MNFDLFLTGMIPITAPPVPDFGEALMPQETQTFGEGLHQLLDALLEQMAPNMTQGAQICLSLVAVVVLISLVSRLPGGSNRAAEAAGAAAAALILLENTDSLLNLGLETVHQLRSYGNLLLGVMTSAMAAQGGVTASTALYAGTAAFDTLLGSLLSALMEPLLHMYLALCIAKSALGEDVLKKLAGLVKNTATWVLKTILYLFTGYIGITGVVSGTTDAAALKAAKLTISGMVPVVGGILSDASEAVLVSAGVVRSAAGIYGILALLAIFAGPFLRLGVQYLMLKLTAALCTVFGEGRTPALIEDFSGCLGLELAMTGSVCLLHLISTVCFLRGVG